MDSRVKVDHERGIITVSDTADQSLLDAELEHWHAGQPKLDPLVNYAPNRRDRRAAEARARRRAAK